MSPAWPHRTVATPRMYQVPVDGRQTAMLRVVSHASGGSSVAEVDNNDIRLGSSTAASTRVRIADGSLPYTMHRSSAITFHPQKASDPGGYARASARKTDSRSVIGKVTASGATRRAGDGGGVGGIETPAAASPLRISSALTPSRSHIHEVDRE
jgi:hypothetical protein